VQVVPHGEAPDAAAAGVDLQRPDEIDFAEVFARAVTGDASTLDRRALAGVQAKVSASMLSTPLRTRHGSAILKLNPPSHPRLVENEHCFLTMAAGCGLPVPAHLLEPWPGLEVWLRHGRVGASSLALASALTGLPLTRDATHDYPRDSTDFRRCVGLLESMQAIDGCLRLDMARDALGTVWHDILDRWEELAGLLAGDNLEALDRALWDIRTTRAG